MGRQKRQEDLAVADRTQRCDVYVVGVPGVDLAARLAVTGELWRAGIRADLQYDDERTMNEVERECLDQNTL
jgi:translation initiation factor 2-alpha kinase 4